MNDSEWVTRFLPKPSAKMGVDDDARMLTGYAIVFNSLSQDLGPFFERIAPSAVDRTLRSGKNVRALIDHNDDPLYRLGSTETGRVKLIKDQRGLKVEIRPIDTANTRTLMTLVQGGEIEGMSFRFRPMPGGVDYEEEDGKRVRTVRDMEFSEVSVVADPAFLETHVSARSAEADLRSYEEYMASIVWKPSLRLREREIRARLR